MPEEDFHNPVWKYYQEMDKLGHTIWGMLLQALGYSTSLMQDLARRPIVQKKMIQYPEASKTLEGQFGVGAHTAAATRPRKLEVWIEERQAWLPVPSIEDVYVINCGIMIMKWSGGIFRSAKHRVINKDEHERLSCATFWHGDVGATNPLNPDDPKKETVGQTLVKRFNNQFSYNKALYNR